MAVEHLDDGRIKEIFKQAILEVFQERKDLLHDAFAEAIEDISLTNAIRDGEATGPATKEEVFQTLEGSP